MSKYKQVGIEFWGGGDKTISEFKEALRTVIPPKEMETAFEWAKLEYKIKFGESIKTTKELKSNLIDINNQAKKVLEVNKNNSPDKVKAKKG